jgi:hypothetical protein
MKKVVLMLILIISPAGLALAQAPLIAQYSADQTMTSGSKVLHSKVYVDHGKVRVEVAKDGREFISIVRPDKNVVYAVMPAQKMVMQTPLTPQNQMIASAYAKDSKREKVGSEMIKGQLCDKYKITSGQYTNYLWANKKTRIPVQMQSADKKMLIEWSNVKIGAQSASLFEPPSGYQRITGAFPSKMPKK